MQGSLSLERGLAILELLATTDEALGVREIARRVELSSSGVQRLLNTLAEKGFVEQTSEARRYRTGHAVLGLARNMIQQDRLVALADGELRKLALVDDLNGFLGVLRGTRAIYLAAVQSNAPMVIRAAPGEPMLLHCTALGKALMLDWTAQEIEELSVLQPFEKRTARTTTDPSVLAKQLAAARTLGYTTALNENLPGVYSIGAPIRDGGGAIVAALSVAFPRAVNPHASIADIGQRVIAAASAVHAGLGFTVPSVHIRKSRASPQRQAPPGPT